MRCLIVGGTGFLGGAMADAVASAGHQVAILSRGEMSRASTVGVEVIHADRHTDLSALKGRDFDWVFDSCAYTPGAVNKLLDALGDGFKRYVMISSISAYGTFSKLGLNEDDPAPTASEEDIAAASAVSAEKRTSAPAYGTSYGPLKRACEIVAVERLGDRATLLRVGLLVGAGDYTDRLTWWVRRIDEAHGDRQRVPAPAPVHRVVQLIDVRDVALFALRCANNGFKGIWNVTGQPIPLSDILNELINVTRSQAKLVWVEEKMVLEAGVEPWTDLPLMAPAIPQFQNFMAVNTDHAVAAGLECRLLEETLLPLLDWDRRRRDQALKGGLSPEQEFALLA